MAGQILKNRVRERRESLGMSQDKLASESGVGRTTVKAIERGEAPSGSVMLRLADALDSRVEDLFYSEPATAMAS